MSIFGPVDSRIQEVIEASRGPMKCRIPQKVPTGNRSRPPARPKGEPVKQKIDNRFTAKESARPHEQTRPKSANMRTKDELHSGRSTLPTARSRTDRHPNTPPKRPSALPIITTMTNEGPKTKGVIMVPISQKQAKHNTKNFSDLPDQDTIKKHEDLETRDFNENYDTDSLASADDVLMNLKITWQENMVQYESMKQELSDQQEAILKLYAAMQGTHQRLETLGDDAVLPSAEELRIMNVTKLTPDQLLRLCSGSAVAKLRDRDASNRCALSIDMQKLHNMPSKLISACEQTLKKRKEIIDWLDLLKMQDKGITMKKLSLKINEFNGENEQMQSSLDQIKGEFYKQCEDIVEFLRKGVSDAMALHLRTEELTYEISSLNSQNTDLRKEIKNFDHLRSNRTKFDEMQNELKEERAKRMSLGDRLRRTDGQLKINQDRAAQLEAALEQARAQTRSLEITVHQLREQNQQLQTDFDTQLVTLTESTKEHMGHLDAIKDARNKLEIEKADLEMQFKEIEENYNESVQNLKHDMNVNVAKLIEAEEKHEQVTAVNVKLEHEVELLASKLKQLELRYKNASNQIIENENKLEKAFAVQRDLEATKKELFEAQAQIIDTKNRLTAQNDVLVEIETNYKESVKLNQSFKSDLLLKEEYIAELEKKQTSMEEQLQENETKMESYIQQLTLLKSHITQLQDYFGEFENINDLYEKVNNQRSELVRITRHNAELAEALQKKEEHLEQITADQEAGFEQREEIINTMTEKEKEQTNIIKILRNNLESRSQAVNNQLIDKNLELETLAMELESNKHQICNLKSIIRTLENQTKKSNIQRLRDQEIIDLLQSKVTEYEAFQLETSRIVDAPAETFESLLKIIEDELGSPIDLHNNNRKNTGFLCYPKEKYGINEQKHAGDRKHNNIDFKNTSFYKSELSEYSNKISRDKLSQKIIIPTSDKQNDGDSLERKRAITKINTQNQKTDFNTDLYKPPAGVKSKVTPAEYLTRNLQNISEMKDVKRYKMYKFAGHRL